MQASTNEWQRVDNTGCLPWTFRALLLSWAIILPYAVITGSKGWFGWSLACVLAGVWLTLRDRTQRTLSTRGMTVDVVPDALRPGEQFLVMLKVEDDKARTIRWWKAEMMAAVPGDDPKTIVSAEFVIDPGAEGAPVAELEMILIAPNANAIGEMGTDDCFVQVTVETERGRMESGRVPVRFSTLD